jgi:hypothetical protein
MPEPVAGSLSTGVIRMLTAAAVAHLISIHDADDLIVGYLAAGRVDLPAGIVQVAGLAVGLASEPRAS